MFFKGTAVPNAVVSISFGEAEARGAADESGKWTAELPPVPAGVKGDLVFVSGGGNRTITDVVSGDIWLCSGQSNMLPEVPAENVIAAFNAVKEFNGK